MPKWITLNGRDENGGEKTLLIHGAYNLAVGDRVTVFPSTLSTRIRAAVSKGLPISVGARVVVVPHARYPQTRIARSAFSNYEVGPAAAILPAGTQLIYVGEEADFQDGSFSNLPIVAWLWDFGDPLSGDLNASTEQNPHHTYNHPGTFDVALQVTNDLLSDTANHDGAVRVLVPYPTSCEAVNLGEGRVRVTWTPGDPNDACRLVRRGDLFPPYPTNGTTAYEGSATSTEEVLPVGQTFYYRVWGKYEGVFSEGYRDASIVVSEQMDTMTVRICVRGMWYGSGQIKIWWDGTLVFDKYVPAAQNSSTCRSPAESFTVPLAAPNYVHLIEESLVVQVAEGDLMPASQHPECRITEVSSGKYYVDFENDTESGDLLWDDPGLIVQFF